MIEEKVEGEEPQSHESEREEKGWLMRGMEKETLQFIRLMNLFREDPLFSFFRFSHSLIHLSLETLTWQSLKGGEYYRVFLLSTREWCNQMSGKNWRMWRNVRKTKSSLSTNIHPHESVPDQVSNWWKIKWVSDSYFLLPHRERAQNKEKVFDHKWKEVKFSKNVTGKRWRENERDFASLVEKYISFRKIWNVTRNVKYRKRSKVHRSTNLTLCFPTCPLRNIWQSVKVNLTCFVDT